MEKYFKKFLLTITLFILTLTMITPSFVYATSFEDANEINIGGTPTINGNTFSYANGSVSITKNNVAVNTTSFSVAQDDVIKIQLFPNDGYNAKLHNEGQNYDVELTDDTYEFTIGHADSNTLSLTPSFIDEHSEEPLPDAIKYDFTINGESFTNVTSGDSIVVPNDFNMNSIDEFYITRIEIEGVRTYNYLAGEYSYDLMDNQERRIFETFFNKIGDNYANLRIISHANDLQSSDIREGKSIDDYFGFYLIGIKFVKSDFKGIEISTNVMPDNYDFTEWNGVDLSGTTQNKPGKITAYYGEDIIKLDSIVASQIKKIELVFGENIPLSAVQINNTDKTIKVLSNYYNEIPLKVELFDGTIGYITINRIGLFIGKVDKNNNTFYHGAANPDNEGNLNAKTNKVRLAAVFYHKNTTTFNDYDLIVNTKFKDGTTQTSLAEGVGDLNNMEGNIVGSDYILWSGESDDDLPKSVSVTAVKKNAISNNNTFGGATFGSGSGVVWNNK